MNKVIHALFLFILCVVVALPAGAQVTITAADVAAQLAPGNTQIRWDDTSKTSLNIGTPGPTSWDFSALQMHDSTLATSVSPASTPYFAYFPMATHAFVAALDIVYSGIPIHATGYQYLRLDGNLLNPGLMGGGELSGIPGTLKTTNTPIDTMYGLPMTFGTIWGSTYTSTDTIVLGGFVISTSSKDHHLRYVVDAYGPMTMPGGSVHDALRIRRTDSSATSKSVRYSFLARDGASVDFGIADPLFPNSGVIAVGTVTWSGAITGPVSVKLEGDGTPSSFALEQNWPNPFNPATMINYTVAGFRSQALGFSMVRLSVYDLLGREVAVLVNEPQAPGRYQVRFDGAGLSSGVYYYRLVSGSFSQTQKMVLMK